MLFLYLFFMPWLFKLLTTRCHYDTPMTFGESLQGWQASGVSKILMAASKRLIVRLRRLLYSNYLFFMPWLFKLLTTRCHYDTPMTSGESLQGRQASGVSKILMAN